MQKQFLSTISNVIRTISRQPSKLGNLAIYLAVALTLAIPATSESGADELNASATSKLAEMTALVRHSEPCPQVPSEWSVAYLALLIMAPPMEEQVKEMEHKMLAFRDKVGTVRWCQLYSAEMNEAYLIYKLTAHR